MIPDGDYYAFLQYKVFLEATLPILRIYHRPSFPENQFDHQYGATTGPVYSGDDPRYDSEQRA